jgi:hypothetical protein
VSTTDWRSDFLMSAELTLMIVFSTESI